MKIVKVGLSDEAQEVYKHLEELAPRSKIERSVLNSVNNKIEAIKADFQYGEPIAKDRIPKKYIEKYGITNLYWVKLANYWRMLYSLTGGNEIEIIALIVDITGHPEYDKKFGYKKK